jgi:hypothetical protein
MNTSDFPVKVKRVKWSPVVPELSMVILMKTCCPVRGICEEKLAASNAVPLALSDPTEPEATMLKSG